VLVPHRYTPAIAKLTQAATSEHKNSGYLRRAEPNEQKGDGDRAIADYRRTLILAPDKTTSDQIKAALKRLGYVENGISAESGRAARRNRR
jgi:predicted TPR repeat methyltransferase